MILVMTEEQQLKLQSFLDGELPEAETREVASWLARDAEATALLGELKNTRHALNNFERPIIVPETREFYWSKISKEIRRTEPQQEPRAQHSLFSFWRRMFAIAGGVAAMVIAVLVITSPGNRTPQAAETATAMNDGGAMTFRNYESGATLVWLSYPAENGLAGGNSTDRIN